MKKQFAYHEVEPDVRLKDYIQAYWYFGIQTTVNKPIDVLPDGYFDLLIVIKNNCVVKSFITGIWGEVVTIDYNEDTEVIGIRFKPMAIGTLLRFSVKDFLNKTQDVILSDFNINQQLIVDNQKTFSLLLINHFNNAFYSKLNPNKGDQRIKKCFELINDSSGALGVDFISNKVGLSTRQLRRVVNSMLGIGLKDYSNIVRLKHSLQAVKVDKKAYLYYYDQSHFIRQIKHYTGRTPEKLKLGQNDRFIQYYDFE